MSNYLSDLSTEELERELKRRKLMEKCSGIILISENGKKAEFALTSLPWPDGKYKISVSFVEELPLVESESELNNESQR